MALAGLGSACSAGVSTVGWVSGSLVLLAVPRPCWRAHPISRAFTVLRVAPGPLHGLGVHADHRALGEQCSALDAGGALAAYVTGNVANNLVGRLVSPRSSTARAGGELLFVRAAQSCRCGTGVFRPPRIRPMAAMPEPPSPLAAAARPPAPCGLRSAFAHRLPHPVRVHRHVHLRQFRPGPAAAVARADGPGPGLFGVPAGRRDDAAGRPGRPRLGTRPVIWGALVVAGTACRSCCPRLSPTLLTGLVLVASARSSRRPSPPALSAGRWRKPGYRERTLSRRPLLGGLAGRAVLGQLFDRFGWTVGVAGVGASLAMAAVADHATQTSIEQRRTPMIRQRRLIDHSDLFTTVRSPFVTKADRST